MDNRRLSYGRFKFTKHKRFNIDCAATRMLAHEVTPFLKILSQTWNELAQQL